MARGAAEMSPDPFYGLEPRSVWAHFATLCAIPRPSLHEAALRAHLIGWAEARGIESTVDAVGNLILRQPASPGFEHRPGVVLQGHLDMVCQKNTGTVHDFYTDPIRPSLQDGWLIAENTTLGADNGIGVALALAALEDEALPHPPLEALFTVNEESGMDGARGLAPGTLHGRHLINLDSEEWGHFFLGCAGGVDVEVLRPCHTGPLPAEQVVWQVDVTGLKGGHSGIDIHLGRGNAIKLLVEFLRELEDDLVGERRAGAQAAASLLCLEGGSARNAIPREAYACIALPPERTARLQELTAARQAAWRDRFRGIDDGVALHCHPIEAPQRQALTAEAQRTLLEYLHSAPNGVRQVSRDFPGVTETSANLGVVVLKEDACHATFKVRSLHDAAAEHCAENIVRHATANEAIAEKRGAYPGWTPDRNSPLLAACQQAYRREFGQPAGLQVIHAGLECGLIAASHPQLEMISFGPDIRNAHAPGEGVEIESVARCWILLKAVLEELATGEAG